MKAGVLLENLPIRTGYKGRILDYYRLIGMTPPTFRRKVMHPETLTVRDIRRINRISPMTDEELVERVKGAK